jgi:hypothetical protein
LQTTVFFMSIIPSSNGNAPIGAVVCPDGTDPPCTVCSCALHLAWSYRTHLALHASCRTPRPCLVPRAASTSLHWATSRSTHVATIRFRYMLHMFHLDVAKVDLVLHMLQWLYTYVASVCFKCFKHMFQVFYLDIAYVAAAIHVCRKCMFQMFHLFQTYFTSVSSGCCICFRYMLQASIQNVSSVLDICYKYVLSRCYSCYTYMLQTHVCKYFICFSMLQKCFHVATLAGVGSGRMQMWSPRVRQAKWAYDTVPTCMCVNRHVRAQLHAYGHNV